MKENNEEKQKVEVKNEAIPTGEANEDSKDRISAEIDVVAEAKKINEELKKQNEIKAKLLEREEKLQARKEALNALGGGSRAGGMPEKPAEPTAKEYAESVLAGKFNKK